MRKLALVLCVSVSLGGCAGLQNAYDITTGASVSPKAVYVAVNAFNAVEATATNYLRLKKCTAEAAPICRSPAATIRIVPAIRSGRVARNNLRQFQKDNPGKLGPMGLYNALTSATSTVQGVIQQYSIGGVR